MPLPSERHLAGLLATVLLAALTVGCGEPVATAEPVVLTAAGSTTLAPLAAELAAAFSQQQPTVTINISGLGTGFGLEALRAGDVEIALASWLPGTSAAPGPAFPTVDPKWRTVAIALDSIAVIVHPSNIVDGLGLLQLQDLFSGRAYEWQAVGGRADQGAVQPVCREEGSGTRAAFEVLAMTGKPVTPRAVVVPSSQAVVDYVAGHEDAIGYVSMAFATSAVKIVQIEGEQPSRESAQQGRYALVRELWLISAESPTEAVQEFFAFALSPAGQQVVGRCFGRIDGGGLQ